MNVINAVTKAAEYSKLQMGADPEVFVRHDGALVPAFAHLPHKGNNWFYDGFAAECTVEPSDCIQFVGVRLAERIQSLAKLGLTIAPVPVWRVPEATLTHAGDAEVALGCNASENAYGRRPLHVPDPRKLRWRSAGGHIHFELPVSELDQKHIRHIVKCLDAFLGVPCVCLAAHYDHFVRRRHYGLAGEYRRPTHGLEYRTLSNFWVMHPLAYMLVFDMARQAFNLGRAHHRRVFIGDDETVENTINYCDVRSAKALMKLNKEYFDVWTKVRYANPKPFWSAIEGGIGATVSDYGKDPLKAWGRVETLGGPGSTDPFYDPNYKTVPRWSHL